MNKIIIGSTCMKYWFPEFNREPKDLDYAVDKNVSSGIREIEYLYNPVIFKYCKNEYLSPDLLLTLKISHLFWNMNWEKHMWDIQFLLKKRCQFNIEVFRELRKFWEDYLPKIHRSNLQMSKEQFFTNAVNMDTNEHDLLHELLVEYPAYKKILKEGCEVELDENKWNLLSFEEKCDVVFEETAVMAFERYPQWYYKKGYSIQLKDNIIKHFPEYIALFAIFNYIELVNPKYNYQEKIKNEKSRNNIEPCFA